ncbi:MAG: 2-amino-4-hydroxy-6-hydroxymethyldihydropteridine diphosphokinase [Candidatus Pelagadaptatus aseana]|uniref:2-amino-4-hydroxy-6- hydroxymethyldihydropteridine diphosphokinase n=1 Tax=Candidatus Pelagadaptatus aseana TaxID=3120508 RepID=UPI0039B3309E
MTRVTAYIGLGSNLETPAEQVLSALEELDQIPATKLVQSSRLYGSSPMGPQDQPDYINAAAAITTELEAHDLLDQLQAIENRHLRVRQQRWGARTLDLDLLLYGQRQIQTERLTVPHRELPNRSFVLYPLADIDPNLTLPSGDTLASLLQQCPKQGIWPLDDN